MSRHKWWKNGQKLPKMAMITVKRKLLQAITTPFSQFAWKFNFWPFFTSCAFSWVTPWSHLHFYWNTFIARCCCNDQQRESYSRPLPPHFPAICLKIQFLAIFDHFSQIVPTHQQSLDPTSAFIGINIMKGCCCNDIYGEKATPHYYHTIFLPENSIFDHFSPFVITQSPPLDPTSTTLFGSLRVYLFLSILKLNTWG